MKFFRLLFFVSALSTILPASAQELNCVVQINYEQIQTTETRIFKTLEQAIYNFMNGRRWTTDVFRDDERIECQILLTLSERSGSSFKGNIQITSRRPVYMSSYHSTIFKHKDDDVSFIYNEFDQFNFDLNTYDNNLTSILGYYAYIIIGLDYDSYELKGGSKWLDYAQKVVSATVTSVRDGWELASSLDNNRATLVQNLNDNFYSPIRECIYNYHRQGLDIMYQDVDGGRAKITEALSGLERVHQARPSSFCMQVFFNAKVDEIVNIYSEAPPAEKTQAAKICKTYDPGHAKQYDAIAQTQ